jgi:hypothetical protein
VGGDRLGSKLQTQKADISTLHKADIRILHRFCCSILIVSR